MDKLRDSEEIYEEKKGEKIGTSMHRKLLDRLRLDPWPCPGPDCLWDKVRSGANYRTLDPKVGSTGSQPDIIVFDLQEAQLGKTIVIDPNHILLKGAVACTIKLSPASSNTLDIALSIDPGSDLPGGDPSTPTERAKALERYVRENIRPYLGMHNPYTNVNTSTAALTFSVTSTHDTIIFQDAGPFGADITSGGDTYGYRLLGLLVGWESPH